jgi:uncharacterized membrane protein YfcA
VTVYIIILILGLVSGCLSGIVGTGAGIILLPVLVLQFGPQDAVPIMAIAGLLGNVGKVASWWRDVQWRAFFGYSIAAAIGAALGARSVLVLPANTVELVLGVFFLVIVPVRHILAAKGVRLGILGLAVAGLGIGFASGIALSTGPVSIPVFAAFGLTKGALISTEAIASFVIQITKIIVFWQGGALPLPIVLKGAAVGASLMAGAFLGKFVVQRMSAETFNRVLDGMLIVAGLSMLWAAFS